MTNRYTADELHGDTYYTLQDGAEFVLASDFAALEAENAELRKQCAAFHAEANDHYRASLAANATLDRLREVFMRLCKGNEMSEAIDDMDAILYPTPENDND